MQKNKMRDITLCFLIGMIGECRLICAQEEHAPKSTDIEKQHEKDRLSAELIGAVNENHPNDVARLIKEGADPNTQVYGGPLLILAIVRGHKEIANILLDRGADVNAADEEEMTALMRAVRENDKETASILLDRGADINAQNILGWTALMFSAIDGHKEMTNILLNHGADTDARNDNNKKAADLAITKGHLDIAQLIKEHTKNSLNAEQMRKERELTRRARYERWKKERGSNQKLLDQSDTIFQALESGRHAIDGEKAGEKALFAYNWLRELDHKPLADGLKHIDWTWYDQIKQINENYREAKGYEYELPSIAEKELVLEAQRITGLRDKLSVFSSKTGACAPGWGVITQQSADLDFQLFAIYHELGHTKHKDRQRQDEIQLRGNYQQFLYPGSSGALAVERDQKQVDYYTQLARQNIDHTSKTGARIAEAAKKTPVLWIRPTDDVRYGDMRVGRWEEAMADLYACDELYKQNKLDPIFYWIREQSKSGFNVVGKDNFDRHPSALERALYCAGFLIDKGIDINKALRDWENKGTCKDVRTMYGPGSRLHDPETSEFEQEFKKEYEKLMKEEAQLHYNLFKKEILEDLGALPTRTQKIYLLCYAALFNLSELRKNPEKKVHATKRRKEYGVTFEKTALFRYNIVREMLKLPVAENFDAIDKKWLIKTGYDYWKRDREIGTGWLGPITPATEKVYSLLTSVRTFLTKYYKPSGEVEYSYENYQHFIGLIEAIYSYNYARELLGLTGVSLDNMRIFDEWDLESVIDKEWVENQVKDLERHLNVHNKKQTPDKRTKSRQSSERHG